MLWKRALIAFTLGPLALFLVYIGEPDSFYGLAYFIPITAVLLIATYEFTNMMRKMSVTVSLWLLMSAVFLMLVGAQWPGLGISGPVTLLSLLVIMSYTLWLYEKQKGNNATLSWMTMMGGLLLFGWIGSHFLLLRNFDTAHGKWTILALLSTWFADSGAYLVGRFMAGKVLGRHQLSPRLSPNKTIEGYGGGIILGTLFTVGAAFVLQISWVPALVIGLLASIVSPLGDLGMSMIKRESKVKDSGHIFGEHGGAIDRVDSLLWSVAMAYYVLQFLA